MPGPYWEIISWCWIVFWVYWTVSALRIHAPRRKASLAFTILNTVLLYVGFVLVLVGRFNIGPLAIRLTSEAAYSYIAGTAFVVAGVALAIWSRRVLGSNWSGQCGSLKASTSFGPDRTRLYATPSTRASHSPYSGRRSSRERSVVCSGSLSWRRL